LRKASVHVPSRFRPLLLAVVIALMLPLGADTAAGTNTLTPGSFGCAHERIAP
jgi:hypothetical protein